VLSPSTADVTGLALALASTSGVVTMADVVGSVVVVDVDGVGGLGTNTC
jgi:hypothetical protein